MDCLGCSNCVDVCPGNKNGKALTMQPIEEQYEEQKNWDKMISGVTGKAHLVDIAANVKNSQFATPLFEFSGACSGCGETPYWAARPGSPARSRLPRPRRSRRPPSPSSRRPPQSRREPPHPSPRPRPHCPRSPPPPPPRPRSGTDRLPARPPPRPDLRVDDPRGCAVRARSRIPNNMDRPG